MGEDHLLHLGLEETSCLVVQPVDNSFQTGDVVLSSLTLGYQGRTVTAAVDQAERGGDANHDDVTEIQVCFTTAQLTELFGTLPNGQSTLSLTLAGTLSGGGTFQGQVDQLVVVGGNAGRGKLHVAARPNPLNPKTELSFRLTRGGVVRVDLFDARGRLIRPILATMLASGSHRVPWDGSDGRGGRVASGSYFFRIAAPEGTQVQRVTVLK
jgi:hypothetical protein